MNKREKIAMKYLPEFVYGGTDGAITTLAVISGVVGASLNSAIILILGFANLFADGFSMAVSNYLSTSSRNDLRRRKYFRKTNSMKTAFATFAAFFLMGFIPLLSFVLGAVTKITHVVEYQFFYSAFLTLIALGIIGWFKGDVLEKSKIKSSLQTIIIGGIAAVIAFSIGYFIKSLIG